MKVKILKNLSETKLEEDINNFIDNINIRVKDIKFSISSTKYSALIIYEEIW